MATKNFNYESPRKGCKDIWNAFMCEGIRYDENDIPFCPTTATKLPREIITWEEAKSIYKQNLASGNTTFQKDAFVCWYTDDYKFDGARGIWQNGAPALEILRHFAGAITPDFSTYQDFPEPLKIYNTYRMRVFGYWLGKNGIGVINNVRWGTEVTYHYSFAGIPKNSVVAIGTCGGSPRKLKDRKRFEEGLEELARELSPHTIVVYGSANYSCFEKLKTQGIKILSFQSKTAQAFNRRD